MIIPLPPSITVDPLPTLPELVSALSLGAWALLALLAGLLFYGYVADRVIFESGGRLHTEKFGPVDGLVASLLGGLFLLLAVGNLHPAAATTAPPLPKAGEMIGGVILSSIFLGVIVGAILGGLSARQISWREIFGLDRQAPVAVVGYAVLFLVLGLPLVNGSTVLSHLLLLAVGSEDDSAQDLVRFLASSPSQTARLVVAGSAVVAAPVLEELIFRGYLYGVARRYAGVTVGIVFNATIFAAIHAHLPSFGGLFVLAVCLTLAYEWSGSIFVPMTMHALFNSISVVQLLHGSATGGSFHAH